MNRIVFLLSLVALSNLAYAQTALPERTFLPSFTPEKIPLNDEVKSEIEELIHELKPGEEVHVMMLSKKENKKPNKFRLDVSFGRYKRLAEWYSENLHPHVTMSEVVIPFDQSGGRKGNVGATGSVADYRQFAKPRSGVHSVVLRKREDVFKGYSQSPELLVITPEKEFRYDCRNSQVIYGDQGVQVHIPRNAFIRKDGGKACCDARIVLKEFLTMEAIMNAELTTHSDGKMLETAGMIHISAWCGDTELQLDPSKHLMVYIPSDEIKEGFGVFEGRENQGLINWRLDEEGEVTAGGLMDDMPEYNDNADWGYEMESEEGETEVAWGAEMEAASIYPEQDGYLMKVGNLGWINCDIFYDVPEEQITNLYVQLEGGEGNLAARMVFEETRSILPGSYTQERGEYKFSGIPAGASVSVIVFGRDNNQLVLATKKLTIGKGEVITLSVSELSESAFQSEIKRLVN